MKRLICVVLAALMIIAVCASCTGTYDKSPDQYKKIRWAASDYSFTIYPEKNCTGTYKFNNKIYNIRVEFEDPAGLIVRDTDNNDERLFMGDWMYEDGNLFIYNIQFNTEKYKAFKENYAEYVTLTKEKL